MTSFGIGIQLTCRTEFELVSALLPPPKAKGRKPTDFRIILNALFYMIRVAVPGGCCPRTFVSVQQAPFIQLA